MQALVVGRAQTPHASVWSPARRTKVALALFGFGRVWFGAAFTAREGAWWNDHGTDMACWPSPRFSCWC